MLSLQVRLLVICTGKTRYYQGIFLEKARFINFVYSQKSTYQLLVLVKWELSCQCTQNFSFIKFPPIFYSFWAIFPVPKETVMYLKLVGFSSDFVSQFFKVAVMVSSFYQLAFPFFWILSSWFLLLWLLSHHCTIFFALIRPPFWIMQFLPGLSEFFFNELSGGCWKLSGFCPPFPYHIIRKFFLPSTQLIAYLIGGFFISISCVLSDTKYTKYRILEYSGLHPTPSAKKSHLSHTQLVG